MSDITAAMMRSIAENDARRERQFHHRMRAFIQHWAPDDQRDRLDFEAELFGIMRSVLVDTSEAFGRGAAKVAQIQPAMVLASNLEAFTGGSNG
jgi:hypothetical protein